MDKLKIPEFARKPIRVNPSKRSFIVKPFSRKLATHKLSRKPDPLELKSEVTFIDKFPDFGNFKKVNKERKIKTTDNKFKAKLIYGTTKSIKLNPKSIPKNRTKIDPQELAFNKRILIESALNNNIKSVTYFNTFGQNVMISDPNSHLGFRVKFDQHLSTMQFFHKSVEHFINILRAKI